MLSKNIEKISKEKNINMYRLAKEYNLSMSYVCTGKRDNQIIKVISKIEVIVLIALLFIQ